MLFAEWTADVQLSNVYPLPEKVTSTHLVTEDMALIPELYGQENCSGQRLENKAHWSY